MIRIRRVWALSVFALVACPRAQTPTAACADGSAFVLGACVPYAIADSFCGPSAKSTAGGGCARKVCAKGEALDVEHGLCLPEYGVLRTMLHGEPRDDDPPRRVGCMYGTLVSRAGQLECAAGAASCGGGERYVKPTPDAGVNVELAGRCEATPPCTAGEIFSDLTSKCERVVRGGVVDVGTWARLAIGVDGAEGSNAFCAPVRAVVGGSRGTFQIEIAIHDNDVTQSTIRMISRPGTAPQTADAAAKSLERLQKTLRFYGGTTLAATASLEVSCTPLVVGHPSLDVVQPSRQDSLDGGR